MLITEPAFPLHSLVKLVGTQLYLQIFCVKQLCLHFKILGFWVSRSKMASDLYTFGSRGMSLILPGYILGVGIHGVSMNLDTFGYN